MGVRRTRPLVFIRRCSAALIASRLSKNVMKSLRFAAVYDELLRRPRGSDRSPIRRSLAGVDQT